MKAGVTSTELGSAAGGDMEMAAVEPLIGLPVPVPDNLHLSSAALWHWRARSLAARM